MKFVFLPYISLSLTLVEYIPGSNYGQIFRDYSGNSLHAINGDSHTTTSYDTVPTDRGAYFPASGSYITMPPNDLSSLILNPPQLFSVIFWVNPIPIESLLLYVWDSTNWIRFFLTPSSSFAFNLWLAVLGSGSIGIGTLIFGNF